MKYCEYCKVDVKRKPRKLSLERKLSDAQRGSVMRSITPNIQPPRQIPSWFANEDNNNFCRKLFALFWIFIVACVAINLLIAAAVFGRRAVGISAVVLYACVVTPIS